MMERIRPLMIPMRGRMIHPLSGETQLQPYGQRQDEVIYSISRADLNRVLIEEAARHPRVRAAIPAHLSGSPAGGWRAALPR